LNTVLPFSIVFVDFETEKERERERETERKSETEDPRHSQRIPGLSGGVEHIAATEADVNRPFCPSHRFHITSRYILDPIVTYRRSMAV